MFSIVGNSGVVAGDDEHDGDNVNGGVGECEVGESWTFWVRAAVAAVYAHIWTCGIRQTPRTGDLAEKRIRRANRSVYRFRRT